MRWLRIGRWVALLALGVLDVVLLHRHWADNRLLHTWSAAFVQPSDPPSEKARKILGQFRPLKYDSENPPPIGAFGSLGLAPREVLEHGGPCESKSRLARAVLRLHGIHADRVLLFDGDLRAYHTMIEIDVEDGAKMAADPLYGLVFPKPGGGYYGIAELQRDPQIATRRLHEIRVENPPPSPPYPATIERHLRNLDFRHPLRTVDWQPSTAARRVARAMITSVLGEEFLRNTPRPYFMDRPALMTLFGVFGLQAAISATWLVEGLPRLIRHRITPA